MPSTNLRTILGGEPGFFPTNSTLTGTITSVRHGSKQTFFTLESDGATCECVHWNPRLRLDKDKPVMFLSAFGRGNYIKLFQEGAKKFLSFGENTRPLAVEYGKEQPENENTNIEITMKPPKHESSRILCPEGQHPCRCYLVAYIGHHTVEWQGQTKDQPKLVLGFELPTETHVFDKDKGPEPFSISTTLTYSMFSVSKLRKLIEGWRGKPYATDDDADNVEFAKFLGVAGFCSIAHKDSNGKKYANLMSIMPLPKQIAIPGPVNKPVLYDIREHGNKMDGLPEWVKKKAMESREWKNYTPTPAAAQEEDGIPFDDEPAPTQGEVVREEPCPF